MVAEYTTSSLFLHVGELGIPELLMDGPRSVDELAQTLHVDPEALYRVLRLLASNRVFTEVSPRLFGQSAVSDTLRIFRALRACTQLPNILQTGRSGFELAFGMSAFEYLGRHPSESAIFNRNQELLIGAASDAIAEAYDWSTVTRVLDIGGGTGSLLSAILATNPHLSGVIFERDAVAADARAAIDERGFGNRCQVVAGDFFQRIPPVEADVAILSHILHDWDEEHAARILRNTRATMRPNDRLLVAEAVLPPGNGPHPGKLMDVAMLVWSKGRERTLEEYHDLLASAGLQLSRVVPLAPNPLGLSVIEAVIATDQIQAESE
jgi:SAM-dependent methyltransferase